MSILIKGIDIPKCSNEDCIVVIRHNKAEVWQTGYKERTVEVKQIPTPHGRLIDEKELLDKIKRGLYSELGAEDITNAPTILEAEEWICDTPFLYASKAMDGKIKRAETITE